MESTILKFSNKTFCVYGLGTTGTSLLRWFKKNNLKNFEAWDDNEALMPFKKRKDVKNSLQEIERTGKRAYVVVESYTNRQELFNLQCWATVCNSFFSANEWKYLFKEYNYNGDYEFMYFK